MLFNFRLVPLNEIEPWGGSGQPNLHWFGLTDSQYWIEVGPAKLLEYSEAARRHGATQFCDYQVVRLYEDVIDLARYVLEPIPSDLVPLIAGQGRRETLAKMWAWRDENCERDDDQSWSFIDAGTTWIGGRQLNTAYLTPSANNVMWSDESTVHIEWDNRDKVIEGESAWTALLGSHSLARSEFIAECEGFHERLMGAMSERVDQVVAGALSPAIQIDVEGLVREHQRRKHLSPLNFGALPSPTDWEAVREAMRMIGA